MRQQQQPQQLMSADPLTSNSDRTPRCPRLSATAVERRDTSTVSRVSSSPVDVPSKNACNSSSVLVTGWD